MPGLFDLVQKPGQIDAAMSRAIAKAIDQAGIRASQRGRTLGSFRLQMPPLQEGPGWQDFLAQHTLIQDDPKRRVRIYLAGKAEGDRRAQLVRATEREYRALRGIDHPGIATPSLQGLFGAICHSTQQLVKDGTLRVSSSMSDSGTLVWDSPEQDTVSAG